MGARRSAASIALTAALIAFHPAHAQQAAAEPDALSEVDRDHELLRANLSRSLPGARGPDRTGRR